MAQLSSLTEIHNYFLAFFVLRARLLLPHHAVSSWTSRLYAVSSFPGDEAEHCCVICKFYYMGGWGGRAAVVCEMCVEKWAKHTTLGGPGVDGQSGGRVLAYPYVLCAVY